MCAVRSGQSLLATVSTIIFFGGGFPERDVFWSFALSLEFQNHLVSLVPTPRKLISKKMPDLKVIISSTYTHLFLLAIVVAIKFENLLSIGYMKLALT